MDADPSLSFNSKCKGTRMMEYLRERERERERKKERFSLSGEQELLRLRLVRGTTEGD